MSWIGYLVAIIGAIGVLLKTEMIKKLLVGVALPAFTQTTYFLIGSVIVVIIGIVLIFMGGSGSGVGSRRSGGEVPIYAGNQIVGYRRV